MTGLRFLPAILGQQQGDGFSVLDIANLRAWYDAADEATITDAGSGAVSQWNDKSGNGRHLTQPTSARRPATGVSTLNGLNVLDFSGDNSVADLGDTPELYWDFLHRSGPTEVWAVLKPGNTANPDVAFPLWATWDGVNTKRGVLVNYDDRSSNSRNDCLSVFVTNGVSGPVTAIFAVSGDNLISANAFHLIEWIANPGGVTTAERNTFIVDQGTPSKTNTATAAAGGVGCAQGLVLGGLTASSATGCLDGSVAELLVFDDDLSTEDRTSLRTYLADKWGL